MSHDDDILISKCHVSGGPARPARLNVDDFEDPSEGEITGAEIHVTIVEWDGRSETPGACFCMSVVSARELVRQLESAIRRREPGGDVP